MRLHLRLLLLPLVLTLCLSAPRAFAQEESDGGSEEDKAAEHFAAGRKLYTQGKYKEAIEELLKAYELRPAPPILLNIGRTYEKVGDKPKALEFYKKFLLKARTVDPNRAQVEKLVKQLEQETGSKGPAAGGAADTPAPTGGAGSPAGEGEAPAPTGKAQLIHTPVDNAKVRQPVTILAELPSQVKADRLWVYFRKAGETEFRRLQMAAQGDAFVAQIAAQHMTSTSLQYYVEAVRTEAKEVVAASTGSKFNPHIIVIEGGRAPIVGQTGPVEIRSPYRLWIWVGAAGTVALLGGGIAMAVLAGNRSSAVQTLAEDSCKGGCAKDPPVAAPTKPFDERAQGWESEGKAFAATSAVLLSFGIAAAGVTGYLWYRDRKYVREQRANLAAGPRPNVVRFLAAPWASPSGAGFVGRIDF